MPFTAQARRSFLQWLTIAIFGVVVSPRLLRADELHSATQPDPVKPLLREFMGLNGHTVLFKPDLYKPVCRLVRDYHDIQWDLGKKTDEPPPFPFARNRVDWSKVYGSWKAAGFETDVSVMMDRLPAGEWADLSRDAHAYGLAFAKNFGPAGKGLVASVEIGNEPGEYDDATYRKLFQSMAGGLREGDPKLAVVTCAGAAGKSGKYAKSLSCVQGLEALYDVINVHSYAQVEGWPTWRRSFPEDPKIRYLQDVRDVIRWRDEHAAGKPVWVTEFGWDASTKPAPKDGTFAKWVGSTETQQAQYLVRSFLVFSAMDIGRAYIYFFDDKDEPQVHGSSGLTRNSKPKPAYYAVAHLYRTLGEYRFERAVVERPGEIYVYAYRHADGDEKRVWVAWLPTGSGQAGERTIELPPGQVVKAERMPLTDGAAEPVKWEAAGEGAIRLKLDESPVYLWTGKP